jgi:hypothetical protein
VDEPPPLPPELAADADGVDGGTERPPSLEPLLAEGDGEPDLELPPALGEGEPPVEEAG